MRVIFFLGLSALMGSVLCSCTLARTAVQLPLRTLESVVRLTPLSLEASEVVPEDAEEAR